MPTFTMRMFRGDTRAGEFRDYRVAAEEGMVVLDVVHRLQATQANDLAVRWNCKAGKFGSCSAEVNGRPRLMCMTRMNLFDEAEPISIAPIRTFPIIRDLVTDVSYNFQKAKTIPPLRLKPPEPDGTYRMMQEDIDRIQEFHKCIECFLCQDVCHVIRDHEEHKKAFAGPRFFIKIAGLAMHPLDTMERTGFARDEAGIGLCNITKCCTEVCPEHIHITDNGIIPMKERMADNVDPIVWLLRKFRARKKQPA
ncbi:MAG: succinate dehydrogenase/fumarate reductase iron-sulfur subunit [Candidatus Rokubacteria bacterium]|nr:succinate dehydrogenase/fumarate reductase iron-sulfur subunit [Candidatus Rokubacteria bacterium]